ncbi:efflux RND transporter periplasmic adaptor subunit [Neotabrizicola sp. sgz301269]|uniref:efflux RND transporter periplasmic adaptor subunit n=1 Tax=Neotabrizicola sp. sgz301269 TaxID=3276282 RepID=UPI0037703B91
MRATTAFLCLLLAAAAPLASQAETLRLSLQPVTDWKAVFGRVEARDRLPARARLGGTLVELTVSEGDIVTAGQVLGQIEDQKLTFQLSALRAQTEALQAQLANAETELKRGEELLARGVTTAQHLDALRTQVDVLKGQIAALDAQAQVITQQEAEGAVLAPAAGRVLDVPVAQGAVIQPGEEVALLGGGGIFLRLSIPERHADALHEGDAIRIETTAGTAEGRLEKVYPLIENGRVLADVAVHGLPDRFFDARVLVRLPLARRETLLVPETALVARAGLDFVAVQDGETTTFRAVVPGERHEDKGAIQVEILSGLQPGDLIVTDPASLPVAVVGHD